MIALAFCLAQNCFQAHFKSWKSMIREILWNEMQPNMHLRNQNLRCFNMKNTTFYCLLNCLTYLVMFKFLSCRNHIIIIEVAQTLFSMKYFYNEFNFHFKIHRFNLSLHYSMIENQIHIIFNIRYIFIA